MAELKDLEKENQELDKQIQETVEKIEKQQQEAIEKENAEAEVAESEGNGEGQEAPEVQPEVQEEIKSAPSIDDLVSKMEETYKLQMEQMKADMEAKNKELQEKLEQEKLERMTETEQEEYRKRVAVEKETEEKRKLLEQVQALEAEKEARVQADKLRGIVSKKSYLAPYLKNVKTVKEYDTFIKPFEDDLAELKELREWREKYAKQNAFGGYKLKEEESSSSVIEKLNEFKKNNPIKIRK